MTPETATTRPRVQGAREQELLDAAIDVLIDVGFDRLTMDAVAARAHASKATLYRRWHGKTELVVDALAARKGAGPMPDTGSLRGDLLALHCGPHGIHAHSGGDVLGCVITAMATDPDFADAFRSRVIQVKIATSRAVFAKAQARGEVRDDLDLDLIAPALAGIVLHRSYVLGQSPDAALVEQLIDQIILPAALSPAAASGHPNCAPTTFNATKEAP